MIYLLTAIGLPPGGIVQYTFTHSAQNDTKQTIHSTIQKFWKVRAVPRLVEFYPGICLTTEEKARKNLRVAEQ